MMASSRTRRTNRLRAERELKLYPCSHCRTERIVAPVSEFVGIARRHPELQLVPVIEAMRQHVGSEGMMALCPGCWCVTSDLSDSHDH